MSGVNKDSAGPGFASMYRSGLSLTEISRSTGVPVSTVRGRLVRAGVEMRKRSDAQRERFSRHGNPLKGRKRPPFPAEWCKRISVGKKKAADGTAAGISKKTNGYVEYTRGRHKGRCEHVVKMEQVIGRRLRPGEVVHHIDGDKHNNSINNLALMTNAAHARLHRREDMLAGKEREREGNGRFR